MRLLLLLLLLVVHTCTTAVRISSTVRVFVDVCRLSVCRHAGRECAIDKRDFDLAVCVLLTSVVCRHAGRECAIDKRDFFHVSI